MNTTEQLPVESQIDQSPPVASFESVELTEIKISGFDGDTRSVWKEPSLYLSIAVIVVAASVCVGNSAVIFWVSVLSMSALAIIFHILAEKFLFRSKKEFSQFAAPFEGVFVLTFGAILPGLGLLSYGVYSCVSATHVNIGEEIGKIALLLVVPCFNFLVWASMRRGYLVRPRLVGLMNGLALGLSACWTAVLLKSVFFAHGDVACKFGWMLLLCTAPFLLFSSICLCLDLAHKTEPNIKRITSTFAILGALLSCLFVSAPMLRAFFMQSLITDARQSTSARQSGAIELLRSMATDEDLLPSKNPVSGFALGALLIPDRGLSSDNDVDKNLYFKITGRALSNYVGTTSNGNEDSNRLVGGKFPGLALSKSQISGIIDAATLSSSIDWTFNFHNSNSYSQEAKGEICLPDKAVISRVTLWINGEPREGAFAPTGKVQQAYESVVSRKRDPLLVTSSGPNRVLFQCFPVPANGEVKIRLGFKVPLQTRDGKSCSMELPKLLSTNFAQPKRVRVSLSSPDVISADLPGLVGGKSGSLNELNGIIKTHSGGGQLDTLRVARTTSTKEFAAPDWFSNGRRFIVTRLMEKTVSAPNRVFVVLDSSASLKPFAASVREALAKIPDRFKPSVYFATEPVPASDKESAIAAEPLAQVLPSLKPESFTGGKDNTQLLREALEASAEQPGSAVLWIHGPQPSAPDLTDTGALDIVHPVSLYDLQIAAGPDSILPALKRLVGSELVSWETVAHKSPVEDINAVVAGWQGADKSFVVERKLVNSKPAVPTSADPTTSAQLTSLWANEEVTRLLSRDLQPQAQELASTYRLITPVTGAVVLENSKDYAANHLDGGAFRDDPTSAANPNGSGLVGVPVDPRYGQSSEVGQLADYGYDRARDTARMLTAASLLLAIVVSLAFLRGRKAVGRSDVAKAVALVFVVPIIVHMMGTFAVNNFGGLGGGL
ncbi:MAG: hypothetical protein JSS83_19760 [Cyanobacteria bacterium SZAS LIN-3]|nr:hypothetical protein [Cyanobacteria bacterium SZAS LIN-3]